MPKKQSISRRGFLSRASALVGGAVACPLIVPSTALGRAGAIAPSNRIVMGAIGVGSKGQGDLGGWMAATVVTPARPTSTTGSLSGGETSTRS